MIIGNGIDILEIERIKNVFLKQEHKLVNKILSEKEKIEYNLITKEQNKIVFLAKHFSSKESIGKALGCGINNEFFTFKDITITHDKLGKPMVEKNKTLTNIIRKFFHTTNYEISISISDEQKFVISNAIIYEKTHKIFDIFSTMLKK